MRWLLIAAIAACCAAAEPVRVVAAVPEIGAILRAVGGEAVQVAVLARPHEDPHRVEARPSFVVDLARAELLVATGNELEIGWLPPLVAQARNPRLRAEAGGFLEAASLVQSPIGVPPAPVDRSAGDVHAHGNPHVLLDPGVGLLLAEALAERLAVLRPEAAAGIEQRLDAFRLRLGGALFGEAVAARLDPRKLVLLDDHGRLEGFLAQQGLSGEVGGWWGRLRAQRGAAIACDHDLYPYFARRFGLRVAVLLEPKPGVPPSTRHLAAVAARMKDEGIRAVLATPYFDRKAIELVARASGARIADMAHQAGVRPGTDDYTAWIGANVEAVAAALAP